MPTIENNTQSNTESQQKAAQQVREEEEKIVVQSQCAKHHALYETGKICDECLQDVMEKVSPELVQRGQEMYKQALLDSLDTLSGARKKSGKLLYMLITSETAVGKVLQKLGNCASNDAVSQNNIDEAKKLLGD